MSLEEVFFLTGRKLILENDKYIIYINEYINANVQKRQTNAAVYDSKISKEVFLLNKKSIVLVGHSHPNQKQRTNSLKALPGEYLKDNIKEKYMIRDSGNNLSMTDIRNIIFNSMCLGPDQTEIKKGAIEKFVMNITCFPNGELQIARGNEKGFIKYDKVFLYDDKLTQLRVPPTSLNSLIKSKN